MVFFYYKMMDKAISGFDLEKSLIDVSKTKIITRTIIIIQKTQTIRLEKLYFLFHSKNNE